MADLDMIKEIPGYKMILKSVLKSQIQLLLEQLSDQTGEESIILTASVHDGSLSHLGSCTGKGFLEGREEIKSQFLGYCLKTHHRAKTSESRGTPYLRSQPQKKARIQSSYLGTQQSDPSSRFTSHSSPNSNYESGEGGGSSFQSPSFSRTESRYGTDSNSVEMKGGLLTSPGQSDHETSVGQFKQEPISPSVVPASTSMLSGLSESFSHSQDNSNSNQQGSDSNIDTHMIKQEAGVEDEEDLEITGVEMGEGMAPENWGQRAVLGSSQESGLELEGSDQAEYRQTQTTAKLDTPEFHPIRREGVPYNVYICPVCRREFKKKWNLRMHYLCHTGQKPYKCNICGRDFTRSESMKVHKMTHYVMPSTD